MGFFPSLFRIEMSQIEQFDDDSIDASELKLTNEPAKEKKYLNVVKNTQTHTHKYMAKQMNSLVTTTEHIE